MHMLKELRSAPKSIKLLVAYYTVVALAILGFATAFRPAHFIYDFSMLRGVTCVVMCALAIWLLLSRARGTRVFCIATNVTMLALSGLDLFCFGAFDGVVERVGLHVAVLAVVVNYLSGILVLALLLRRQRLDEVFNVLLDSSPEGPGYSFDKPLRERVRTWPFWRDLAIYFIVFSFVGHWAEILFCKLIVAGVFMGGYDPTNAMLWDQWLFPFSAEGTALVMMVVLLHPLKEWLLKRFDGRVLPSLLLSFLANMAVCTSIDFGTGMVANRAYELWDYRDMPFNFMGQVCLQNSLVYSIAATLMVWCAYPAMDRALRRIPRYAANALFVALVGIYAFEALLHFVEFGL